jgi:alpha-beta hydrolase superfamily lysophospholipase
VMNAYATFLLEARHDGERAESLLVAASQWGRYTDARSLDRATTYELLARIGMESGDFEAAVRHARLAIDLVDHEASTGARRVLAESLRRSGDYDAAADAYLELIALERGTQPEDVNALKLIVGQTDRYAATDVNDLIEAAIEERTDERRRQFEAEGAELITIESEDGYELEGTLRRRDGGGAVLFVPDLGGTRTAFRPYAQLLGVDGFSSLTLDLRGQGGSRSDSVSTQQDLSAGQFDRLPDDIVAGFRFLERALDAGAGRIVIVSEGRSSALVERAMRRGRLAAPVVHLSPAFEPDERVLRDAIAFHPDRPILLFYSDEDLSALRSVSFYKNTKEFRQLEIRVLHGAGHGVDVLRRDAEALEVFQRWIRRAGGSAPGAD